MPDGLVGFPMAQSQAAQIASTLFEGYEHLKELVRRDAKNRAVAELLADLTTKALQFLSGCQRVPLVSKVHGKTYFSFTIKRSGKLSRAVNEELFNPNIRRQLSHLADGTLINLAPSDRSRLLYTVAMVYCCASDLLKTRDQKTPATFFECFIGHLVARSFGVNPRTQVEVLHLEDEAGTLPTDFIFDLGPGKSKFHVPVKTSTRERVIQVFAHQRVLDGVHGFGTFKGILVCLTETKLDHKRREVVEICVPKQWVLYYRFIASMHRFYYFDIPTRYAELTKGNPPMPVRSFATFFEEVNELAATR
jgi:hypothetical protein